MSNVTRFFALLLMMTAGTYIACSSDPAPSGGQDAGEEEEGDEDESPPPTPVTPPPSDPGDASTDAPVIGNCFDEESCPAGQFCNITNPIEPSGTCTPMPTCTNGAQGCSCIQQTTPCATTHPRADCIVSSDPVGSQSWARSCGQNVAALRTVGQTCSFYIGCQVGLHCRVENVGQAGTCVANPPACGTNGSCDCVNPSVTQCPVGRATACEADFPAGGSGFVTTITCIVP